MVSPEEANYLNSGRWAERNPSKCPCGGQGWWLTDLDVAYQCPVHGNGVPNNYDDQDDGVTFDWDGHTLQMFRIAFQGFRYLARQYGFRGNKAAFVRACRCHLTENTPEAWVNAAEAVYEALRTEREEAGARRRGYSCALEERWAEDAAQERAEHGNPYL